MGTEELRMPPPAGARNRKPQKNKSVSKQAPVFHPQNDIRGRQDVFNPPFKTQTPRKTNTRNDASSRLQNSERSNSHSLLDISFSAAKYRDLRRKYLLMEEENFLLRQELTEADAEIKILEQRKFALLDQLLVLEGLIDPSDLQPPLGDRSCEAIIAF